MFKELDVITLTSPILRDCIWDIPPGSPLSTSGEGLRKGDIGTIVCMQGDGEAFDVEFMEPGGHTVAIATVLASQARPATKEDIASGRDFVEYI
ncbi:MAG: DUF4926 domain-containing protein [Dehalococcoidia bacterium]|nr:DUF4926 domain-containing protein [Dehalococcoidia bacterium]